MAAHTGTAAMASSRTVVLENGTMFGAIGNECHVRESKFPTKSFVVPEIVISASLSSNSLNRSRCDMSSASQQQQQQQQQYQPYNNISSPNTIKNSNSHNNDDSAAERQALLEGQQLEEGEAEFEQFILNRTTSESNMLDSSICSELQFSPSTTLPPPSVGITTPAGTIASDMLNTSASACSRSESRQSKRTRRKANKSKAKCNNNALAAGAGASANATIAGGATPVGITGSYPPPQYTAIFLDHHHGNAANAIGQLANGATASPFLNSNSVTSDSSNYLQYHQCYQQRPMSVAHHHHHLHHTHRRLVDMPVPVPDAGSPNNDGVAPNSTIVNVPNTGELGASLSYRFPKWFARPSLPFVIGIFALGGVACTLGGIVLGSTGLIEHSTQYLSAALLMIGIGVSLLVIAGAIWRLSLPDDVDDCPCFRIDPCRRCNSVHCNNRMFPGGLMYPEFQHGPPPPPYMTSLNEFAYLFHPNAAYATMRVNTPPPFYRSTYSLNGPVTHGPTASATMTPTNEITLPQISDLNYQNNTAIVFTREAVSQTSFKDIDESNENQTGVPLASDVSVHEHTAIVFSREAVSQTSFKESA